MDRAAIDRITAELEALLLPDHPYQAAVLRGLRASVAKGEQQEIERCFASLEMWGGSGSVADVYMIPHEANDRLNGLLVELVEHFSEAGITFPRANSWASTFKKWHTEGTFKK